MLKETFKHLNFRIMFTVIKKLLIRKNNINDVAGGALFESLA
jgi:hypothetical protein